MFLRKIPLGVMLFGWTCGVSPPLAAQEASVDPTSEQGKRAEGKARYERGAQAYSAGRYKDAIDYFLQADALASSAALSFNIARAYEKIGDDAASLQWYRDFRRRAPDAKNGPEVDERIRALEGMLAKKGVQQVTILSTPLGATVIVDEQPVGVTPFTGQFPPGRHKVVLSLRGYLDSEQRLELAADRAQDLNVPLVPGRAASPAAGEPLVAPGAGNAPTPVARTRLVDARAPAAPSGPRFGPAPWIGMGAGVAVLGASLAFELSRRSAERAALADGTQVGYQEKLEREQSRQSTARLLAVVGGALFATGGTLLIIDLSTRPKRAQEQAQVGISCLPGLCGLDVRGHFQ